MQNASESREFLESNLPAGVSIFKNVLRDARSARTEVISVTDVSVSNCTLNFSITRQFSGSLDNPETKTVVEQYSVAMGDISLPVQVGPLEGSEHFALIVKVAIPTTVVSTDFFSGGQVSEFSIAAKDQDTGERLAKAFTVVVEACKAGTMK